MSEKNSEVIHYEAEEHYPTLKGWADLAPAAILPNGLVGLIDGEPVIALFIYLSSNAPIAFVEHATVAPGRVDDALSVVPLLLEHVDLFCEANGALAARALPSRSAIRSILAESGWSEDAGGLTQMLKIYES